MPAPNFVPASDEAGRGYLARPRPGPVDRRSRSYSFEINPLEVNGFSRWSLSAMRAPA
jgi:hypothetical protein